VAGTARGAAGQHVSPTESPIRGMTTPPPSGYSVRRIR
jgi:hypothetical protein